MTTNEEKLELAKKCGAIINDVVPYDHRPEYRLVTFNEPTFLAYTSAIEEKYQAQIAMLNDAQCQQDYIDDYEFRGDYDYHPSETERMLIMDALVGYLDEALSATQATAEAFRAEVEARALEEAANVAYAWPDDQHAELELRCMAAEKRKQAEQGKEPK